MGSLVGCYVVIGFIGMGAAVFQLRRDPNQLKVYRPSDTIRFPNFRKGTALSSWKVGARGLGVRRRGVLQGRREREEHQHSRAVGGGRPGPGLFLGCDEQRGRGRCTP